MSKGKTKKAEPKPPKRSLRERFADSVEVSKEITLDVAKITMIGSREISIENYSGILEYSENSVLIKAKPSPIKVCGSFLEIAVMTKELLYITGSIKKISFSGADAKKTGKADKAEKKGER